MPPKKGNKKQTSRQEEEKQNVSDPLPPENELKPPNSESSTSKMSLQRNIKLYLD